MWGGDQQPVAHPPPALRFSEHLEGDGAMIFKHACRLGLEGIVAKRKGSAYRSDGAPLG